jgi:hypothetical protein
MDLDKAIELASVWRDRAQLVNHIPAGARVAIALLDALEQLHSVHLSGFGLETFEIPDAPIDRTPNPWWK